MRTIVEIPDEAVEALTEICQKRHISRTEAVRQAVAIYIEQNATGKPNEAFGLWKSKRVDGRKYEDKLRGEWR